jgi:hypothetical protein
MRRFFFCLVIAGLAFSGCSEQKQPDSETKLFREFSLGKIAERIHSTELKGSSGSSGFSSSTGISRRRDFSLTYMIEQREGAKFDEVGFITKLKVETERVLDDAGVRRDGGGLSGDAFNLDYSNEDHEGWVEVVGTRMEGDQYKLWGVIRESTKNARQ